MTSGLGAGSPRQGQGAARLQREQLVADHLRHLLRGARCRDEMLVICAAAQAGTFTGGWLVSVALDTLLASAGTLSADAFADEASWRRLRAYRQPHRGAACALHAADVSIDDMRALTIADIAADGSAITPAPACDGAQRHPVTVAAPAREFVRAQLRARTTEGAEPADLFFFDGTMPYGADALTQAIRVPAREVGVVFAFGIVGRSHGSLRHWMRRSGVAVQAL